MPGCYLILTSQSKPCQKIKRGGLVLPHCHRMPAQHLCSSCRDEAAQLIPNLQLGSKANGPNLSSQHPVSDSSPLWAFFRLVPAVLTGSSFQEMLFPAKCTVLSMELKITGGQGCERIWRKRICERIWRKMRYIFTCISFYFLLLVVANRGGLEAI